MAEEKKASILVVDDEVDVVETLKRFLARKGHPVAGALSVEEALAALAAHPADAVLLDVMMPDISGKEVARVIRSKYPLTKIFVMTAYPDKGREIERQSLSDGLFIKPLGPDDVYAKMLDTLRQGVAEQVLNAYAKLLFLEPSKEIFSAISDFLAGLAGHGEHYQLSAAADAAALAGQIDSFKPDAVLVNSAACGKEEVAAVKEKLSAAGLAGKEISYHIPAGTAAGAEQLKSLNEAVLGFCIEQGLLKVKC